MTALVKGRYLSAEEQLGPVKVNCVALGADPSGDFFEQFEAVSANLRATAGNGKVERVSNQRSEEFGEAVTEPKAAGWFGFDS